MTKEEQEQILSYQNGQFISLPLDESTNIDNAVEALKSFNFSPSEKAILWHYSYFVSFASFAKGNEFQPGNFYHYSGLEYSAIVWKYWQKIADILGTLKEIETLDMQALVQEYKTANNIE